jgi:hypothetical protein
MKCLGAVPAPQGDPVATATYSAKAAPEGGFLKRKYDQRLNLVAGVGFEPTTFRL